MLSSFSFRKTLKQKGSHVDSSSDLISGQLLLKRFTSFRHRLACRIGCCSRFSITSHRRGTQTILINSHKTNKIIRLGYLWSTSPRFSPQRHIRLLCCSISIKTTKQQRSTQNNSFPVNSFLTPMIQSLQNSTR